MSRTALLGDVRRRMMPAFGLTVCLALLALVAACGPLGDDDEDDPTPTSGASPAASAATPAPRPAVATPSPRSSPGATEGDEGGGASPEARTPEQEVAGEETAAATEGAAAEATDAPDEVPTPPVAEGCEEPEELPAVVGPGDRVTSDEADEGVNLRAGPGADCDLLTTLPPGTPVEVISGPVSAGDFLWVKVEAAGDQGWVAQDFLDSVAADEEDQDGA